MDDLYFCVRRRDWVWEGRRLDHEFGAFSSEALVVFFGCDMLLTLRHCAEACLADKF